MRLADPLALWLLVLAVAAVAGGWWGGRGRRRGVGGAGLALVASELPATWRTRARAALGGLRLLTLATLIVALARPQSVATAERVSSSGIDIILALDTSGSMRAEDFQPDNRLTVAKRVIRDFIRQRQADRIGLVVFAGTSFTQCPLTLDYPMLDTLLAQVDFDLLEDGTAIGTAIANGVNRLADSHAKSRILILLTDGENNAGPIDPMTGANLAKARGVRIYTIAVGKEGVVRMGVPTPLGLRYPQVESHIDEAVLKQIAEATGGRAFRADAPDTLAEVFATIDQLEKSEVAVKQYHRYGELFPWPLAATLLLVLGEIVLRAGPLAVVG